MAGIDGLTGQPGGDAALLRRLSDIDGEAHFPASGFSVLRMGLPAFRGRLAVPDRPFLTMVSRGSGVLDRPVGRSRRETAALARGRYGIVLPGDSGEWQWDRISVINVGFPLELLADLASETDGWSPHRIPDDLRRVGNADRRLVASLADAFGRRLGAGTMDALFVEGALLLLLSELRAQPSSAHGRANPFARRQLDSVLAFIDANLGRTMTVAEMAGIIGYSRFHFLRAFRAALGETPHRFVIRRRIERAKQLLADPEVSISEAGLAVGFGSSSHFASAFRQWEGTSPTEWRQATAATRKGVGRPAMA